MCVCVCVAERGGGGGGFRKSNTTRLCTVLLLSTGGLHVSGTANKNRESQDNENELPTCMLHAALGGSLIVLSAKAGREKGVGEGLQLHFASEVGYTTYGVGCSNMTVGRPCVNDAEYCLWTYGLLRRIHKAQSLVVHARTLFRSGLSAVAIAGPACSQHAQERERERERGHIYER